MGNVAESLANWKEFKPAGNVAVGHNCFLLDLIFNHKKKEGIP